MIEIISGTDRPYSNTIKVAKYVLELYRATGADVELLDLSALKFEDVAGGDYHKAPAGTFGEAVARVTRADGLVLVVPEYNGSYPGALKLFIDYWKYPLTFESRPMAFIGLGLRWGGLRPVEHLQQVMGYRNAFLFPNRVFLTNIKDAFKDGKIADKMIDDLLKVQSRDFLKFVAALKSQGLDANSRKTATP
jgi:chromate reductase, NAD(P)H dehydrogenase (quinone)